MQIPFTLWMIILNLKIVKYVYVWCGLVFESLAHKVDMHLCFSCLYLLTRTLALLVSIPQLRECTSLCLLRSDVVNCFLAQ